MEENTYIRSELAGRLVGIVMIVIAIVVMLIPTVGDWDMMRWGYGTVTIGFFVFIAGFVTFSIYNRRYTALMKLFNSEEILAHWEYPDDTYAKEALRVKKENIATYKWIYKIMFFFFLVFTTLFAIFGFSGNDTDSLLLFIGMMGTILLIITGVALVSPRVQFKKALKANPEVYIGNTTLLYLGQLHVWGSALFKLSNVAINVRKNVIVFTLKYFTKVGWYKYETYQVSVPIPVGKLAEAQAVIKLLEVET